VRNTRIHRACGLLNGSDLGITEIADQCGFTSVYAFSRTFRKVVGKPPTRFRQGLRA
jgi:AraC-like DNA-binding protein